MCQLEACEGVLGVVSSAWLSEFVDTGGVDKLTAVLQNSLDKSFEEQTPQDKHLQAAAIGSLRRATQVSNGVDSIVSSQPTLRAVARCEFDDIAIDQHVWSLLSCVCSTPPGHSAVLSALTHVQGLLQLSSPFDRLVRALSRRPDSTQTADPSWRRLVVEHKTTLMSLLNALINTPQELTVRNSLRKQVRFGAYPG